MSTGKMKLADIIVRETSQRTHGLPQMNLPPSPQHFIGED